MLASFHGLQKQDYKKMRLSNCKVTNLLVFTDCESDAFHIISTAQQH